MDAVVDFKDVVPKFLKKNDYITLDDNSIVKVIKADDEKCIIFSPEASIEKQGRKVINRINVKNKLELWAFDDNNNPIAKISDKATFVKKGHVIRGWVRKDYYDDIHYEKIFMVKCPCCNNTY